LELTTHGLGAGELWWMMAMIPFLDLQRQYRRVKEEILAATQKVYDKGVFILGEEVSTFEEEFACYCGVRYGVGVGSGTDALCLALRAAGIGEGDEVITVANSFIATALAISFAGAKPLFVDIDPKTLTIDPNAVERLVKDRMVKNGKQGIKAILPVHLYGHPAPMDAIMDIAKRYHLIIVEDACQAHGAVYRGRKIGSFGLAGCFSFYPTKNVGGYGDGGMVVTDDGDIYEKLRLLRCYGEAQKYHHVMKGGNSRLDELQAAILRVKLRYLDQWNAERRERALMYSSLFEGIDIIPPVEKEDARHVYHLYVIRTAERDALQRFLHQKGIGTLIHYPLPIHLQEAYSDLPYREGDLPVSERAAREVLSLPCFPEMTAGEIEEVAGAVRHFLEVNR
jgi:dTDP-4-amino-4,6-dideoxygalactose transaminase